VTLTEYNVEQGTEEWLAARRGIVTASVIGQLITYRTPTAIDFGCPECGAESNDPCRGKANPERSIQSLHRARTAVAKASNQPPRLGIARNDESRSVVAELAAERLTGFTDDHYVSDDMFRGHEDEPRAIEAYEKHYGVQVRSAGFLVNDDHGFRLGCSPDGLVGDDGLVECKSRRPKKHVQTVIADEVPAENMAQIMCGLLVTGRSWCDYISYSSGLHLWVKRVTPDERWFRAIVAAATEFEMTYGVMRAKYEVHTLGLPLTERIVEEMSL
jgi:hypothetical protein